MTTESPEQFDRFVERWIAPDQRDILRQEIHEILGHALDLIDDRAERSMLHDGKVEGKHGLAVKHFRDSGLAASRKL